MPTEQSNRAAVASLSCQLPEGAIGLGKEPVRLSWTVTSAELSGGQTGYEIQSSDSPDFRDLLATSGEMASPQQVGIVAPGPVMKSRERRFFRVRIETEAGWTDWGPTLQVESGLVEASDWSAEGITLPGDPGAEHQAPVPLLRREFDLPSHVSQARLHVTALGICDVAINGAPVSDELFNPGWSTYHRRLLSATYDVTHLLRRGPNLISAALGDGWYRGRLGWNPEGDRCNYGEELALIAQLEIDTSDGQSHRVVTDESWKASTGSVRSADFYDGTVTDLRQEQFGWASPGFDDGHWDQVKLVPYDKTLIQPRLAPPVRRIESRHPEVTKRPDGVIALDGGQNIAGFVKLTMRGRPGDEVKVRHAEVLGPDGSLHTHPLRSAKATDTYVLAGEDAVELEPAFTFHGFRYAEVESQAELLSAEFVAISSDLTPRSSFECSHSSLNRFHENVMWSQRDNFVSLPTDCPQRDERLGWTGDAQAFAPTACTLFDSHAFWLSWLEDLSLDQDDELGPPAVVPDVVIEGEARFGRAGWADAAAIVPWAVFESYGDPAVLERQYDSMVRWVDSLVTRREADGLLGPAMQFGDWLDPDAPMDRPWEAKADSVFLSNAFFSHSARLLADAASTLEKAPETVEKYREIADEVASLTWERWGAHVRETQTGCAVALQFDIVPESERAGVAATLARMVGEVGGRVSTGFLGTPLVLPALSSAGFYDEAYAMLLRNEFPSWLYQVEMGATTVWERWDAIRPDGSIHPGTMSTPFEEEGESEEGNMLSFNHYAYGAVIDWVYRNLAGIAPDVEEPGYRRIVFAPRPVAGVSWAHASIDTPYGQAAISWDLDAAGGLVVDLEIPFGAAGVFIPPATAGSTIRLDGEEHGGRVDLLPGRHRVEVTSPSLADPSRATASTQQDQ